LNNSKHFRDNNKVIKAIPKAAPGLLEELEQSLPLFVTDPCGLRNPWRVLNIDFSRMRKLD